MASLTHLYVIPITGPDRGQGRICLVCKTQSSPALISFIKPSPSGSFAQLDRAIAVIDATEELAKRHPKSQSYIVILTEARIVMTPTGEVEQFDSNFQEEVRQFVAARKLAIPIAGLPTGGLPDSVPVNFFDDTTVMIYRNRFVTDLFHGVGFADERARALADTRVRALADVPDDFQEIDTALSRLERL